MTRRESSDLDLSRVNSQPPSTRGSLTSSGILGHFSALTSSIQRRLSNSLSTPPTSPIPEQPKRPIPDSEPPLAPITLKGYLDTTTERVLTEKFAEEIRLMLPARLQVHDLWDLVYSLDQHGVSLSTLYSRCKAFNSPHSGWVIIVRDRQESVFGAYLSHYPHIHPHYYGTGECFLFKFTLLAQHHSHPSISSNTLSNMNPLPRKVDSPASSVIQSQSSTEASQLSVFSGTQELTRPSSRGSITSSSPQYQFKGFPYTGLNDYMILCLPQFLSVGGGFDTLTKRD